MQIDGTCHCGAIQYTADVEPGTIIICHCTDCQQLCGSPWRASIQTSTLRFTQGSPKRYIKTAASGRQRVQAFCADCGSHIYASAPDAGPSDVCNLRIGSIVQRAALGAPKNEIWTDSALSWSRNLESVSHD